MRLVIARCSVDYEGRLSAHLPEALRLIMVKADGCVAIHADGGAYKPLNWMNAPNRLVQHEDHWTVTNPKGETLTIFGPWCGEDEALVHSVLDYFIEATGVTINYSSSENYEQQIVIDTQAGSPPNIAILPQPGLLQDLASKGFLVPLGDDVATFVKDNYGAGQSWVDLGTPIVIHF